MLQGHFNGKSMRLDTKKAVEYKNTVTKTQLRAVWEHSGRCAPAQPLLVLLRAPESSWMLIMKPGALLEHSGDALLLHCSWELLTNI